MKRYTFTTAIIIAVTVLFLSSCKNKKNNPTRSKQQSQHLTVITATKRESVSRLYYKATLAPLKNTSVLSPVNGSVKKIFFQYGGSVKNKQKLVSISSAQLADKYRQTVTKYLQSKDIYETAVQNNAGNEALYKAGAISTSAYRTSKSQFENNTLSYYQAKYDLEKILRKAHISPKTIEQLTINDTTQVNHILQRHFSNLIVRANANGVALFPVNNQNNTSHEKTNKLEAGTTVKEDQLLLSIGDLSGFSTAINVSEVNINKIKTGLNAIVTGDAFPGIKLRGKVTSVARQANPSQGGGLGASLSMFNIIVQIPSITLQQRRIIHVGMTAKVQLNVQNDAHIILPIKAITQQGPISLVTIIDPKTGKQQTIPVTTGETTLRNVQILSGIKSGDKVILHD